MSERLYGVDLHTHTCYSDGADTPVQLIAKAAQLALRTVAITDHDTVAAIPEAQQAGAQHGIEVLAGIELSIRYHQHEDIHLLAYLFDPLHKALQARLQLLQERPMQRGAEILERVNALLTQRHQAPLDSQRVLQHAAGVLTRPHLAQELIAQGYSTSVQNAFRDFLIPCNVPNAALGPEEALALIAQAGGVCSLAHPGTISSDPEVLRQVLSTFKALGLVGVEVYHRSHYPHTMTFFHDCAQHYGLIATGGSDYHGYPGGATLGEMVPGYAIPVSALSDLRRAHADFIAAAS